MEMDKTGSGHIYWLGLMFVKSNVYISATKRSGSPNAQYNPYLRLGFQSSAFRAGSQMKETHVSSCSLPDVPFYISVLFTLTGRRL